MPATCTFLLHQLSLLLLVGLHLFVGSFPPDSPPSSSASSSSASPSSPQFATGPRGSAAPTTPEASPFAAASSRLPWEPSPASSGSWDSATERRSSSPAIMNSQKAAGNSHTESRTSSPTKDNGDAFSTFENDKGRTLRLITGSVSVSTAAIGRTASYPETGQFGDLAQDSSLTLQTRRADAPSNTLDILELETVPLMTHSPHTPVSSLLEHNFPAPGSSHHRDSSWEVESTTPRWHTESMDGSVSTVHKERTLLFLTDSITLTSSATEDPVSQTEFTVSSDQTQFAFQATQPRRSSTTSNTVQFSDSIARTVLTNSLLSLNTDDRNSQHTSSIEKRATHSQTDSIFSSAMLFSDRVGTMEALTNKSKSIEATEMSSFGLKDFSSSDLTQTSSLALESRRNHVSSTEKDFTETSEEPLLTYSSKTSFYLSSTTDRSTAEGGDQLRSNSSTQQNSFTSQTDSLSILGVSDRSGGTTLQPLIDIHHSHNTTQTSISSSNDVSSSLSHTHSSYVLTPEQTSGMNLTMEDADFTETALVQSQAYSETTDDRNSQHTSSIEKRATHSQTDSLFSSATLFSDRVGTMEALTNKSKSIEATEMSSFGLKDFSSSDLTQTSSLALESRRNHVSSTEKDFTETSEEPLLTYSSKTSFYLSSTTDRSNVRTKQHTFSTSNPGKGDTQTESTFSSVASIRDGNRTLESLTDSSKFTETTPLSAFDSEEVNSSDLTQSPSVTVESGENPVSSKEMHFTKTSEDPFLTSSSKISISSPSTIDLSSPGKSHQPVNVSDPQGRISSASTDSVYLSTTFIHGAERTLRSLPDNSTSDSAGSSISNTEASHSSDPTLTLTSVAETEEHNVSLSEGRFTERSTAHLLENSSLVPIYSSSPEDPSTFGSGHHRASSSGTEVRASYSYIDTTHSSASFSNGEEQTVQPVMKTTFAEVTESSSSYMERSSASELNHFLSGIYSETTDFSRKDLDISGPSTETVQSFTSSRIPTYSSFQSEPSDTAGDFDRTNTEKISSSSHTDSTYISVPFTKGGERTLLSVSNNSTSFYEEMSTPLESAQSSFSMTQNIGSNFSSSDRNFSAPSTEPLAVQSLHTPGYSSTVSYSISESTSARNLSFLSSSPTSSLQSSIPPTQSPALFSSSESSWPASSSAFPTQLSSQMPSWKPSPRLSSTALPTFPPFSYTLPAPSSASSSLQPSINLATSVSITEHEGTTGTDISTARSSTNKYSNQTGTYPLKDSTDLSSTGSSPLQTEATEQLTNHSAPVTDSLGKTKGSREPNVSLPGTSVEKSVPVLTTSPTYLSESSTISGAAKLPKTTQKEVFSLVEVTTGKNLTNMTHATIGLPTMVTPTYYSVTAKSPKVQSPSSTKTPRPSETTTKGMETSSAPTVEVIVQPATTTHPPTTLSSSKPTTRSFSTLPVPTKLSTVAWLGSRSTFTTFHGEDIDECLSNPCPALATCTNTQGSFQCTCSLGYQMEKGNCNLVRTFVGQFPLMFNTTGGKYSELHQIEGEIINALNISLSTLPGYYTSTVKASRQSISIQVSITSTFSVVSNVTLYDIVSAVRSHIRACKASSETCRFMSSLTQLHRAGGLCKYKDPECDKETSACVDFDGIADCQCKPGYFRYNKLDHSCRACEDGYKLENDTCVSCPFGLGGFNCANPYQLITIVIAAAGGGLLLILGIALIVTCCQKNKNDISKLIFKSGDFQMSPYAEYPKNPRVQDWGRETIEMQENGSTKNLLQMTDVYYMPTNLRNPELERNGLYPPYTGLPGSRHSCIYPGQYNPSFISDDSRRRDYF